MTLSKDIEENTKQVVAVDATENREISKYSNEYSELLNSAFVSFNTEDYHGEAVNIYAVTNDLLQPDSIETAYSRLVYARNAAVEEKLSVKLITSVFSSDDLVEQVKRDSMSGTSDCDILMTNQNDLGVLVKNKLLQDLSKAKNFSLEYDFIFEQSAYSSSLKNEVFGISGSAATDPGMFYALFYCPADFKENGIDIEQIYTDIQEGKWTWEQFEHYSVMLGNASIVTPLSQTSFVDMLFKSFNNNYLKKSNNSIIVGFDADNLETLYSLFNRIKTNGLKTSSYSSVSDFTSDYTFMINKLSAVNKMSENNISFGILPIPGNNTYGYYTQKQYMFSVPESASDLNMSYEVILALNAAADVVNKKYYQDVLSADYNLSKKDVEMVSLIVSEGTFDINYTFKDAYSGLTLYTDSFVYSNIGKTNLKKSITALNKKIAKIIK